MKKKSKTCSIYEIDNGEIIKILQSTNTLLLNKLSYKIQIS